LLSLRLIRKNIYSLIVFIKKRSTVRNLAVQMIKKKFNLELYEAPTLVVRRTAHRVSVGKSPT
jgi:hypothetical protein